MSPKLYSKITKLIKSQKIKSLTVDVFDTIMLYGYWPADLRYYDIAVRWLPTIHRYISPDITTYELYDRRIEAKRALDQQHLSSRIDIWLDVMVDGLCSKYNVELDENTTMEILTALMAIELEFEMENVRPNTALIDQLAKLKKTFPKLKIYFIADSTFMSEQISMILNVHEVTIFDGGVSSADYNKTKASGELFEQLEHDFGPSFDLSKNLHLGDGREPDFLAPSQHDSLAIHYRPIRMRGLRTLVGTAWLKALQFSAQHRAHRTSRRSSGSIWEDYGHTLAEIYRAWTCQMQDLARTHDTEDVILAGEDAIQLAHTSSILQNNELTRIAPELTKPSVLRAFIWLLAASQTERWDAARLLQHLASSEQLSRTQLYDICFEKSYLYSPLAINSFDDDTFYTHFLQELLTADAKYTASIRQCYKTVASYLPSTDKPVFFIRLHDDNLVAIFQNFAELHGITNHFSGAILDTHNLVHQSQAQLFGLMNPRREQQIITGLTAAGRKGELAAATYLQQILLPKYQKLTQKILHTTA